MLHVSNSLLASIEKYFPVTGLLVGFLKGEMSWHGNGLCISHGIHGMQDAKVATLLI